MDTIRSLRRVHFALLPWKRFRFSVPETTSNCLNFGHAKDDEGWPAALVKRERSCITDHRRPAHTSALSVSKKTRVSELCPVASTSIVSPRRLYSIRNTDSRTPAACDFVLFCLFFCFLYIFWLWDVIYFCLLLFFCSCPFMLRFFCLSCVYHIRCRI